MALKLNILATCEVIELSGERFEVIFAYFHHGGKNSSHGDNHPHDLWCAATFKPPESDHANVRSRCSLIELKAYWFKNFKCFIRVKDQFPNKF